MKIELEVDSEQLKLLDSGLKDLLTGLTEEQQVQLLQNYINNQLEGFRKRKETTYWRAEPEYEYTNFGKQVIDGLQDRIQESITQSILDKPTVQEYINETIQQVEQKLPEIIEKAIIQYTVDNLVSNKQEIFDICLRTYQNMRGHEN